MSCNCGGSPKIILQGQQYCQNCMPDEFEWLVKVSKEPDPFLMDRTHAYITPDNTVWVLDYERLKAVPLNPDLSNINFDNFVKKEDQVIYSPGENITIGDDNVISASFDLSELEQAIRNSNQQSASAEAKANMALEEINQLKLAGDKDTTYSAGDGIYISDQNVISVNGLPDKFISSIGVTEGDGTVTLTYTYTDGDTKEVTFNDDDTVPIMYDDTWVRDKIAELEGRTDENTKYSLSSVSIPSETNNIKDFNFTDYELGFGRAAFETTELANIIPYKGAYSSIINDLNYKVSITKPDGKVKRYNALAPLEFSNNVDKSLISRDFSHLGLFTILNLNLYGKTDLLRFTPYVDVYNYDVDTGKITSDPAITVPITKEVFLGEETASAVFPDGSEVVISFTGDPTITTYRLVYQLKEVTE